MAHPLSLPRSSLPGPAPSTFCRWIDAAGDLQAVVDENSRNASLNASLSSDEADHERFRLWWLADFLTVVTASCMLLAGVYFLVGDTLAGCRWWTTDFWLAPLPPKEDPTGTGGDKKPIASEATPLKEGKKKLPP